MEFEHSVEELQRLAVNQQSLLNTMPAMVLLVNMSKSIDFMNPSALAFWGDLRGDTNRCGREQQTKDKLFALINQAVKENRATGTSREMISDCYLEYFIAPFVGYQGDNLFWLMLRDLTEQQQYQEELERFHTNIESILAFKIEKLTQSEQIRSSLTNQLDTLNNHLKDHPPEGTIIGSSLALKELRDMVFQVAKSDATILITGESGTGKELVANLIRETSNRNNKPFLKINCNTINDSLLESDLFGYEKGAFTGAHTRKKGKFEVVDGGTIFLDEIGDISPRMQAALLRVLQDKEIIRVGGNTPLKIDVRIIAATNADLAAAVQSGSFRLDLYYRLNIINIVIPPLRERKEDIIELVTHFVRKYRIAFKKDITFLPKTIINRLVSHNWPGNVRELENVIQRAVLMAKSNIITEQELIFDHEAPQGSITTASKLQSNHVGQSLKSILAEIEGKIIAQELEKTQGNVALAAQNLKIGKTACYEKMKRHNIAANQFN